MELITTSVYMEAIAGDRRRLTAGFRSVVDGTPYTIPAGFTWDGASLPRFAWALHGHPYDDRHLEAGLWHDAAYSGLFAAQEITRAKADAIYRNWLRVRGMPFFKAFNEWLAVRLFGGSHWTETIKEVNA